MAERSNVTFAKDLDTVKTILNALASEITQDAVNALLPHASNLFFKVEEKKTLYYSADIPGKNKIDVYKGVGGSTSRFREYNNENYKRNLAANVFGKGGSALNVL